MGIVPNVSFGQETTSSAPVSLHAVVRFSGVGDITLWGKKYKILAGLPMDGENSMMVFIPNVTAAAEVATPKTELMKVLSPCLPNDLLEIEYVREGTRLFLQNVRPYRLRFGEEEPDVYIFLGSNRKMQGRTEFVSVDVMRYLKKQTMLIPNNRAPDGTMRADQLLMDRFASLKAGDLIQITSNQAGGYVIIQSATPLKPSRTVEFIRAFDQNTGKRRGLTLEVRNAEGNREQLLLTKDALLGGMLADRIRRFTAGDKLLVRTEADQEVSLLINVRQVGDDGEETTQPASEQASASASSAPATGMSNR